MLAPLRSSLTSVHPYNNAALPKECGRFGQCLDAGRASDTIRGKRRALGDMK